MDAQEPIDTDDRDYVSALARGLRLIEVCGESEIGLSLAQVAQRSEISRAAARRFLLTLHALGYVSSDGKLYRLTPKVLVLGNAFLGSTALPRIVRPVLENLSRDLGESCSVAVLDGSEIVYVAREQTGRIMSVDLGIGSRLPAASTSMGRVLLAALPPEERARRLKDPTLALTPRTVTDRKALLRLLDSVEKQGWCVVDQELELGLRSMAVPLRDAGGRTVGALNVGTQVARVSIESLRKEMLPKLRAAAAAIEPFLLQ
ncbi:IclR family transcriptional regulator C-terminal domain-containing protein [Beijerinckia sp. L45]|uniref:IclR family transcriptional regulator domain-containing protein n=1 Tax=Beijerinckia sp. L45 TaxID=1641855 RepID=UPI00131A90EE|nr:IclR family transcriptional regulator C-terminal domain-containing protein [Beijerinckia sp. L45]